MSGKRTFMMCLGLVSAQIKSEYDFIVEDPFEESYRADDDVEGEG